MTRYLGLLGVKEPSIEVRPGVYKSGINEKLVSGFLITRHIRYSALEIQQQTPSANQILSIIPPQGVVLNFETVAYITYQGLKWSVSAVKYAPPRVLMTLGGIYNGD